MKSINFISKMMNWIKKDQVKHLPSIVSGKRTDNGPITDRQRTDHSFIAFHALRYVAATALLLCLGVGQMWGADISNYAHGWEDNSTSAYTNSNATLSISSEARTGTKSMQTYYNGTGDRRIETTATFAVTTSQTMYAIGYAKLPSGDATAQSISTLAYLDCYLGGGSTYTSVQLTTSWQRMTAYKKPGSNQTGKTLRIQRKHANKGNVLFDDIIVYVSTDSKIDLKKPDSASSASASTSSISWTEGTDASDSDNGATGVQKTLIFRRSSGSLDDLTLNDQGIYSLTSSEGPSTDQSEHWTLVAVINTGTEFHSGTFSAGDRYAIVHRDLAYNYSTPTYVTVAGGACTAPNHVDISGNWDYFGGETISLSAQAYSSAGTGSPIAEGNITGYQWKHNGVNIAGATSKTFTKTATGPTDGGNYSCVVSTGATCSTESSPYGTKVYALEFYTGGTTDYNFTRVGTSKVGIVDVTLPASTQREFKIYAGHTGGDGQYYGNGDGTYPIKNDISEWDFEDGKSNCKINPGLGGTFRFTIDYTANGGKPKVSVTYPKKAIYLTPNSDWKSSSAKFAYYYFNANTNGWTDFLTAYACGDGVYVGEVPVWDGVKIDAVRFNSTKASTGNWDDKWNQTSDITVESGKNMVTITGWDESQTYTAYAEPTYTITFAGNGSTSGSMSSITSIACDADQALTANVFEKTGYTFANWTADVDVKVSGATVTTGNAIANSATIQNVRSNIALTAQWTPKNYDLTWNLGGGTTTSAGTGIASGVSSNTTSSVAYGTSLSAPTVTKTGYNFSAWSPSVASTMPAEDVEYTATWTANQYSVTHSLTNMTTTSGATGANAATYGTNYTAVFAASSGYALPETITVTIGGSTKTQGTEYTWDKASGTVTITGSYITGDIVITVTGVAAVAGDGCWDPENTAADKLSSGDVSLTTFENNFSGVDGITSVTIQSKGTSSAGQCSGSDDSPSPLGYMKVKNASSSGTKIITIVISSAKDITIGGEAYGSNAGSFKIVKSTEESTALATASTGSTAKASNCVAGTYYIYATASTNNKSINFSLLCIEDAAPCTTPTTTLSNGAYTVGGSALDLSTLISSSQGSGAITYTVTDANGTGATIAGTSFTASSAGTASIRATQAANGAYCEKVMNATVTVSAAAGHTVTYQYNGATGGASPASATGASVTLPTPTKTGCTFQGWYESSGTKAGNGGATYNPAADITLYALWRENCGGGAQTLVDINFKSSDWSDKTFSQGNDDNEDLINGVYFWSKDASKHFSLSSNTSNGLTFPNNNMSSGNYYFCIPITGINASNKEITVTLKHGYSSNSASYKYAYIDGRTSFVDGNTGGTSGISVSDASSSATQMSFTKSSLSNTSGHLIIGRGSSSYTKIYGVTVTTPGNATCYYVTYNGNGADGGFTKDEEGHGSGSDVSIVTNGFTRTGYTFTGWNTAPGGGGTAYPANGTITGISGDVTLYAQWSSGTLYSVTYNGNGNTGGTAPATASHAAGSNVTVLGNTGSLEKTNYTFDGWATANDGTGTSYVADGTISSIAADVTLYAKWKQTVTLNTGSQGSGADKTPYIYWNGTTLNSYAAHTADGYTLQGYYTAASAGTKVLNADGSFAGTDVSGYITSSKWSRTGTTTLYAQWRAAGGASCNTIDHISDFPTSGSTGMTVGNLTVTYSGSSVERQTSKPLYNDKSGNTIKIGSSGADKYVQGYLGGNEIGSLELGVGTGNTTTGIKYAVVFSASSTFDNSTVLSYSKVNSEYEANIKTATSDTLTNITVPSGAKYFRIYRSVTFNNIACGSGSSVFVWHIKACSSGSSTHTITYANGGGSGTMASNTGIADNGSHTLTTKTFTAPTNYTFAGWVADVAVTIGGDTKAAGTLIADGATITNITTDINLTAKWSLPLTLNTGSKGGDADEDLTVYYNSTSITGHTPHTAAGYRLLGYYTASSDGTKVLNADGSFAGSAVSGYTADGKWTYTSASSLTLYAQWEAAALLKWNLKVNVSETSITTTSKESATVRISTENMTNLTNNGSLTITGDPKSALTSKIATTAGTTGDDAGKYMSVQFQIANGYKLIPTAINVKVQPISHSQTVYLVLEDNNSHSINYTSSSISKGSTQTVTMSNGSNVEFTGTVTLKIYCYGTAENNGYRLGTPIEINGAVEEACTMPSYTGLDYEQTEYLKDATASALTVTDPADVITYLWKQNTSNDRTGGSAASGTNNTVSYTPPTGSNGVTYYWCELTNACGTVKTPAVAITVRTDKTDPTVAWTDPAVTVNYGGGGYTLRATVNETTWDGTLAASMLTAPAGINIHDVTIGTAASKQYIEVKFDVQTSFDKTTYASNIPFTLSLPETTNYDATDIDHNVAYSSCSGAGAGTSYNIRMRKTVTKDGNYYYSANADGWISPNTNSSHGTAKAGTAVSPFDTVANSNTSNVWIKTYHANINKVRLYCDFSAKDITVTGVYKHTTYFTADAKYSVEYTAVYNGDENADDLGEAGEAKYVDITLNTSLDANDILLITFSASKARPMGAVLTEASGGSISTTLTFANAGPINKTQNDAAFTNVASTTSNSLGAIRYTSSDAAVATVDVTTGAVTIVGVGSTTITATLAASGCYRSSTANYTLNVSEVACEDVAGTVATRDLGCDGIELTVSGYTDGATIQWYKDGVSMGGSYTNATCTVTVAGEYYAITNQTCDKASNTVTLAAKTVTATRLVDSWYVKNGRLTPDIALVQTTGAENFTVTSGGDPITSIGGCEFYLGADGIIYLKGAQNDGSAPSGMTLGDQTITITASVCSSNASVDIVIHRQVQTDKHVLAFVVTGTGKAGFTDGISADQTTNVPLYNTLTENFDVLATNVYSTDDEKKLKEYYSQFDILCVTDYPNTGEKGVNKKSYVDALGSLIDIRPILTMEAFVAKWGNWKAKGVSGTPSSPSERQYTMLLQCKDHEIFAGTTLTKIGEGDEAMYRITMVDKTLAAYDSLDNAAKKKTDDYPALQGFAAGNISDEMLPLGLIDDGAGNDLQVGIERQHAMEARMMVLGINGYAMERLTADGQQVIVNALKYLMKKNAEDIADCSVYFDNSAGDNSWNNVANWGPSYSTLPLPTQEVRILQPCTLTTTAHVAGVKIVPNGRYNHDAAPANGKLTIEPTGALIVDGKVQAVTAPRYYERRATTPDQLIINTNQDNQACLILNNNDATTRATVSLYSLGCKDGSYKYQYMAVPMTSVAVNPTFANETYPGKKLYTYVWQEATNAW